MCAHNNAVSAEEDGSCQDMQQEEKGGPVPQLADVEAPEQPNRTWGTRGGTHL